MERCVERSPPFEAYDSRTYFTWCSQSTMFRTRWLLCSVCGLPCLPRVRHCNRPLCNVLNLLEFGRRGFALTSATAKEVSKRRRHAAKPRARDVGQTRHPNSSSIPGKPNETRPRVQICFHHTGGSDGAGVTHVSKPGHQPAEVNMIMLK